MFSRGTISREQQLVLANTLQKLKRMEYRSNQPYTQAPAVMTRSLELHLMALQLAHTVSAVLVQTLAMYSCAPLQAEHV